MSAQPAQAGNQGRAAPVVTAISCGDRRHHIEERMGIIVWIVLLAAAITAGALAGIWLHRISQPRIMVPQNGG